MSRKLATLTLVTFLIAIVPASAAASKPKPVSTLQTAWSYLISLFLPSTAVPPEGEEATAGTPVVASQSACSSPNGDQMSTIDPFGNPAC